MKRHTAEPIMFRYSLSSLFRFVLGMQLCVAANYLFYLDSRSSQGERLGWPFEFYVEWKGIMYYQNLSFAWLIADVLFAVFVSILLARFRVDVVWARIRWLQTAGTPFDDSASVP